MPKNENVIKLAPENYENGPRYGKKTASKRSKIWVSEHIAKLLSLVAKILNIKVIDFTNMVILQGLTQVVEKERAARQSPEILKLLEKSGVQLEQKMAPEKEKSDSMFIKSFFKYININTSKEQETKEIKNKENKEQESFETKKKVSVLREKKEEKIQIAQNQFQEFWILYKQAQALLGALGYGPKNKAEKQYLDLGDDDRQKIMLYFHDLEKKIKIVRSMQRLRNEYQDYTIKPPFLESLSHAHKFLRDKEWTTKYVVEVRPAYNTTSAIQIKVWKEEGLVEGIDYEYISQQEKNPDG